MSIRTDLFTRRIPTISKVWTLHVLAKLMLVRLIINIDRFLYDGYHGYNSDVFIHLYIYYYYYFLVFNVFESYKHNFFIYL